MQAPTQLLTYEEYRQRPYDGRRTELVDGRVIELGDPTALHNDIVEAIEEAFKAFIRERGLAYRVKDHVGVQTPRSSTGRSPDLLICTDAQWQELRKEGGSASLKLGTPPLLVVEVISKSTEAADMGSKKREYQGSQVPEYWRAHPEKQWLEVLTLVDGKYQIQRYSGSDRIISKALPGLELTAEQVLEV